MNQSQNPLASEGHEGLSGGAGNDASSTNPSTMYHDVSSSGNGVSASSAAALARPRVPTFSPTTPYEGIHCNGSRDIDGVKEASFPKKVVWQALFGKKKFLPLAPMLDNDKCPYKDASERWADDPAPVTLGRGFSNFYGLLIDLQKSMA